VERPEIGAVEDHRPARPGLCEPLLERVKPGSEQPAAELGRHSPGKLDNLVGDPDADPLDLQRPLHAAECTPQRALKTRRDLREGDTPGETGFGAAPLLGALSEGVAFPEIDERRGAGSALAVAFSTSRDKRQDRSAEPTSKAPGAGSS
jgi:hypothetical protein